MADGGSASVWYTGRSGAIAGPFDGREIERQYHSGELRATDFVWASGWPEWRRVGEAFAAPPPPQAPPVAPRAAAAPLFPASPVYPEPAAGPGPALSEAAYSGSAFSGSAYSGSAYSGTAHSGSAQSDTAASAEPPNGRVRVWVILKWLLLLMAAGIWTVLLAIAVFNLVSGEAVPEAGFALAGTLAALAALVWCYRSVAGDKGKALVAALSAFGLVGTIAPGLVVQAMDSKLFCYGLGASAVAVLAILGRWLMMRRRRAAGGESPVAHAEPVTIRASTSRRPLAIMAGGGVAAAAAVAAGLVSLQSLTSVPKAILLEEGHGEQSSITFSPDGQTVLTVSAKGEVNAWAAQTGKHLRTVFKGGETVDAATYNADGSRILVRASDYLMLIDSGSRLKFAERTETQKFSWSDAVFSDNGRYIAAVARMDHTVRVFDARSGDPLAQLYGHGSSRWGPASASMGMSGVSSVGFADNDKALVSKGYDGRIIYWDLKSEQPKSTVVAHEGLDFGIADPSLQHAEASTTVALMARKNNILFWHMPEGRLAMQLIGPALAPDRSFATYDPRGVLFAVGSDGGTVDIWAIGDRRHVAKILYEQPVERKLDPEKRSVQQIAFSRDGAQMAVATDDGVVRIIGTAGVETGAALPVSDYKWDLSGTMPDEEVNKADADEVSLCDRMTVPEKIVGSDQGQSFSKSISACIEVLFDRTLESARRAEIERKLAKGLMLYGNHLDIEAIGEKYMWEGRKKKLADGSLRPEDVALVSSVYRDTLWDATYMDILYLEHSERVLPTLDKTEQFQMRGPRNGALQEIGDHLGRVREVNILVGLVDELAAQGITFSNGAGEKLNRAYFEEAAREVPEARRTMLSKRPPNWGE